VICGHPTPQQQPKGLGASIPHRLKARKQQSSCGAARAHPQIPTRVPRQTQTPIRRGRRLASCGLQCKSRANCKSDLISLSTFLASSLPTPAHSPSTVRVETHSLPPPLQNRCLAPQRGSMSASTASQQSRHAGRAISDPGTRSPGGASGAPALAGADWPHDHEVKPRPKGGESVTRGDPGDRVSAGWLVG
jgi:hypothetical protein